MVAELRIGTSGYSFPDWVGTVYPDGTRPAEMLSTYARDFDTVEINFTYYRDPTPEIFERMLRKVDAGFEFVVKAPRGFTHERDRANASAAGFVEALRPLIEAGQLGGVLVQFPQAFHRGKEAEVYVQALTERLPLEAVPTYVEFRHDSWMKEEIYRSLHECGLGFVNVDLPRLRSLPTPSQVVTGQNAYVRLHGRNAAQWHGPSSASLRYDYRYSDEELDAWVIRVETMMDSVQKVYVFTNNCHKGSSFVDALRMKQRLGLPVRSSIETDATLFATADPGDRIQELSQRVDASRTRDPGRGGVA
jgi:uncharacterized protein YecE (DUF72 family)